MAKKEAKKEEKKEEAAAVKRFACIKECSCEGAAYRPGDILETSAKPSAEHFEPDGAAAAREKADAARQAASAAVDVATKAESDAKKAEEIEKNPLAGEPAKPVKDKPGMREATK